MTIAADIPYIYPNWMYSLFAFVGFLMTTIPFAWHLEAWNTGTCLYMAWTSLLCLNYFINSVVWTGNAFNPAPVWCDISSRFIIGASVAIPAASLCINRRLYHIATCQTVTTSKAERRRGVYVDLAIGLGIPFLQMVLEYVVQGHRFDIWEDIGCMPATYNVALSYPLVSIWPIVIGLVSASYCIRAIRAFRKRRNQFKEFLSSNGNNVTPNRYFRLMCLAGIEVVCTVPLASWMMYLNISNGINPWVSWGWVHADFHHVDQIPSLVWHQQPTLIELARWNAVICAFVFFAFFGFADEAKKHYYLAYVSVAKKLGYTSVGSSSGFGSSNGGKSKYPHMASKAASLPVFVKRDVSSKIDTFGSFADDISVADLEGAMTEAKFTPDSSMSSSSSVTDVDAISPVVTAPKQAKVKPMPPVMAMMDTLDFSALDRIPSPV